MDSMKSRLITAAVGIPLVVIAFVLGEFFHWIMYALVAILCVIMIFELLTAKKLHNNLKILIPCALYALLQPLLIAFDTGLLPLYIYLLLMFFIMILSNRTLSYADISFAALGTIIVTCGLSSILILPHTYSSYFTYFFVSSIGIPWFSDSGAYFAGVFLGKHKLCPRVSPNKTVEGFVGGIFAGTLSSLIIAFVFSLIFNELYFNYGLVLLVGLSVSVVSVLGDLSFSLVKRSCGIKDYGSIFPGHGGFLDRFDSVIFSAPIIYLVGSFLPLFTIGA